MRTKSRPLFVPRELIGLRPSKAFLAKLLAEKGCSSAAHLLKNPAKAKQILHKNKKP